MGNLTQLHYCAAFHVPPCRGLDEGAARAAVKGSQVKLNRKLTDFFLPKFDNALSTCTTDITFTPANDGSQNNSIRQHVSSIGHGTTHARTRASQRLAHALALATDNRSRVGLMLVLVGGSNGVNRVAIWKYPSDESITAHFSNGAIQLELIKDAFTHHSEHFKAAIFEGTKAKTSFWEGKVEDRQSLNSKYGEVAKFWINDFLLARPSLSDTVGTKQIISLVKAMALRERNAVIKDQLFSSLTTLKSRSGEPISFAVFADNYLPKDRRQSFLDKARFHGLDNVFRVDADVMDYEFAVRQIQLHNHATVTAPDKTFDQIVRIARPKRTGSDSNGDGVTITVTGIIVSETYRRSKAFAKAYNET